MQAPQEIAGFLFKLNPWQGVKEIKIIPNVYVNWASLNL